MDQGWVTFQGHYDRDIATKHYLDAGQGRSVYPAPNQEAFNILHGDQLFMWLRRGKSRGLKILASLNGAGRDVAAMFPDDPDMQREAIKNDILPIGTSRDTKYHANYNGPGQPENLAVQILGIDSQTVDAACAPGMPVMWDVPSPDSVRNGEKYQKPGEDGYRATLQLVPFTPASLERTIRTHMEQQIFNSRKYVASLNPKSRKTMAWLNFGHTARVHALMSFLLIFEGLTTDTNGQAPVLEAKFLPGKYDLSRNAAARAAMTPREVKLALARNFGLIDGAKDPIANVSHVMKKTLYSDLFRELSARVFFTGKVAEFGTGYDGRTNPGVGQDRKIKKATADGEFLLLQFNHWPMYTSAMVTAANKMYDFYAGTCLRGAGAGGLAAILKKR
jgi:hypothetical protein